LKIAINNIFISSPYHHLLLTIYKINISNNSQMIIVEDWFFILWKEFYYLRRACAGGVTSRGQRRIIKKGQCPLKNSISQVVSVGSRVTIHMRKNTMSIKEQFFPKKMHTDGETLVGGVTTGSRTTIHRRTLQCL